MLTTAARRITQTQISLTTTDTYTARRRRVGAFKCELPVVILNLGVDSGFFPRRPRRQSNVFLSWLSPLRRFSIFSFFDYRRIPP